MTIASRVAPARLRRAVRTLIGGVPLDGDAADLESMAVADRRAVERARPYTMTSVARLRAVVEAVRYCVDRDIPGSFAECGVWRGGSVLAMIYTLQELGSADRDIYLFDTFEGMTEPTEHDVSHAEGSALVAWRRA